MMLPPIARADLPTIDRVASSQAAEMFKFSDGVRVGGGGSVVVGGGRNEVLPPAQLQSTRMAGTSDMINTRLMEVFSYLDFPSDSSPRPHASFDWQHECRTTTPPTAVPRYFISFHARSSAITVRPPLRAFRPLPW